MFTSGYTSSIMSGQHLLQLVQSMLIPLSTYYQELLPLQLELL